MAALYHDVGMISRPEYFVENQYGGPNPHDKLSPAMSALILFALVKQGVETAEEYRLGREIGDIIQQHHGTRGAMFFYNKAVKLGENPSLQDYSYPGPRPQTKEAAIVMLADAVEASSRTLGDPTPARIRTHVTNIVKGVYAEGQLDESDLAFRDLDKIIDSFVRIITGHFHQRIAYPDAAKAKAEGEKAESEKAENEAHGEEAKAPEASKASAKEDATASARESAGAKDEETATGEAAAQELKPEWVVPSADEHHGRALTPPRKGDM